MSHGDPARVRLLVLDVDGVLTDGRIWMDETGNQWRGFSVQDGTAVALWHRAGHATAVVTAKTSRAVARRVEMLGIGHYVFGNEDKLAGFEQVVRDAGCGPEAVCYVGDDVLDLAPMKRSGYPVAVANAVPALREIACYVTQRRGGDGAVAEVVEHLLRAQGQWECVLAGYDR
jgi:3-deoxy-D-manno-octulosonate 8-phosphate phosphatase (KDO 8-P phosphatase)